MRKSPVQLPPDVDPNRVDADQFVRAGGDAVCDICGFVFAVHPDHPITDWDGNHFLVVSCEGVALKL